MSVLSSIAGGLVCLGVPLSVAAYLVWASRRPACPKCHHALPRQQMVCRFCGHASPPTQSDALPRSQL